MQSKQRRTRRLAALAAVAVVLTPAAAAARASHPDAHHLAKPTQLAAQSGPRGLSLTWSGGGRTGFQIEQASDAAMTQGVRRYSMNGAGHEFTPLGLSKDQTYYFRVRASYGGKHSGYSNEASATATTQEQPIEAMTYNIEELTRDGHHEGTGTVAKWSKRKVGAAALIRSASPDVISIQEGASWVNKPRGPRQVDSLRSTLGSPWKLALTETPTNQPHYFRTGVYIIYNSATVRAVGKGGHFPVGGTHWAAYQTFASRASGAKFLFVSSHLQIGFGHQHDVNRQAETVRLLRGGSARAASRHVPVFYAGDFNSGTGDSHFTYDGPGTAMIAANVADAFNVAQSHTNAPYNSANQYIRKVKKTYDRIDHVYAPPGVGVVSAGIVLQKIRHGRFVGVIPSDHNPLIAGLEIPY